MPIVFDPSPFAHPGKDRTRAAGTVLATPTAQLGTLRLNEVDEYGCEIWLGKVDGWDSPESTTEVTQRTAAHGAWATRGYLPARALELSGWVVAPSREHLRDAKDRLAGAVSLDDIVLRIDEQGLDRFVTARRQGAVTWEDTPAPMARWTLSVVALDPRKYSSREYTATMGIRVVAGGVTLPVTLPLAIEADVTNDSAAVINRGNVDTPVTVDIWGQVQNPRLAHVESGRAMTFAIEYDAARHLMVDMERRTAILDGAASRLYVMSGEWFAFLPGTSTLQLSGTSITGSARAVVRWRDAWL